MRTPVMSRRQIRIACVQTDDSSVRPQRAEMVTKMLRGGAVAASLGLPSQSHSVFITSGCTQGGGGARCGVRSACSREKCLQRLTELLFFFFFKQLFASRLGEEFISINLHAGPNIRSRTFFTD